MFNKILIANRGEIACRIIETARRLGIRSVAVYSDADAHARHVRMADEAHRIGPAASSESYLKSDVILDVAKRSGAEAIHPGYGFLSENEDFARACADAGIAFIGPTPEAINAMGLKDRAKAIMEKAGVPIVPGYQGDDQDLSHLQAQADAIGYPVLIKAVAGGGGKGMRLVEKSGDFADALASCQREAQASFGNSRVLIEKYITRPRHVEVQIFGDTHGNAVHLYERDCSLQRRHQKVVEEAPAPGLSDAVRARLGDAAVKAVKALGYINAGTIEFIMDSATHEFFFMEMNTRLQVEHPVTEMITGQDLVEWQLRVAAGQPLPLSQSEIPLIGHAFEVRLYAEDPAHNFLPQTGRIDAFVTAPDARTDTGIESGDSVTIHYDPMVAKIIVHGDNRAEAIRRMTHALHGTGIAGLTTNQEFLHNIFRHPDFIEGNVDTGFIPRFEDALIPDDYALPTRDDLAQAAVAILSGTPAANDIWNAGDNWRMNMQLTRTLTFTCRDHVYEVAATCHPGHFDLIIDGERLTINPANLSARIITNGPDLTVIGNGHAVRLHLYTPGADDDAAAGEGRITAPMPGKIISVLVGKGDSVDKDQPLLIMEAMKMEMTIRAGCAGIIEELPVANNDQVADGALLVSIKGEDAA